MSPTATPDSSASSAAAPAAAGTTPLSDALRRDPALAAFWVLRVGFVALPLLMGLDKFTNLLTDWPGYLAPWIVGILPIGAQTAMHLVGIVEIVAGIAVAVRPRLAAWVVALWLLGIIVDLLSYSGFFDVALRDVGLLVAAIALGLLSRTYNRPQRR
ncbi:hypothetical protein [Brachybacterium sp. ACRRE]|uniref:hypothetical protein n=1 Tax=Brachybacterium sp. ACRRE TaxID=2918184 RepID=UPI001EF16240|nr:hypothetical protein [Brachybacterium sp. ACRRE]MCG7309601.1 hypothetical protein [Brachybacterium sp. ACRRE]